jgi:hypothetical protein
MPRSTDSQTRTRKKTLDDFDQKVEEKYGIGSDLQIAAQAISGLFAGLAGGNVSGAVAAGAAPLLAQMVKQVSQGNEPMRVLLHTLASGLIAKAQGGSTIGGAAGGLTAGLLSYNDALSHLLYGKDASALSADEKMLVANIVTLAGAAAGGAVDGSAGVGSGASAGRTEVENNYLSSKDKSRQTYLRNKKDRTQQEQQDLDALNLKDAETSKMLVDACMNGSASACSAARKDAQEKQATYQNLGYQNPKEAQEGYQQIERLLNDTSPEARQTQEIYKGMVAAYVRTGMSEGDAKAAVGYQLGAIYIVGGIAGIGSGKAVDEGQTPGVKSGNNGIIDAEKATLGKSGENSQGVKPSGAELQQQAEKRIGDLASQFNDPNILPKDFQLSINGKAMATEPDISIGAPEFKGATDADVMTYFKQLAGSEKMPEAKVIQGKGEVYSVKVTEGPNAGSTLTLRNFSTSAQQTGAKWTIDLMTPSINNGRRVEVKFK